MSKNLKLIKDLIHIQLKKSLSELKEVEADTDTEFKVSLKHLLKKHVVKGGEVEEAELEKEKFTEPDQMREAINVKSLKSKYEKAIKKEQALSSLMLMNLVKYKQAKASGNEKAIAKYTKIAGDLSPKKKDASVVANDAYQAYEDAISGLHADAELQIDEASLGNSLRMAHLARGLKPLLIIGSTIKSTVGEDALLDLSDKFEDLDDENADDIASHLNMGIELMQDRSPSEARAWLKKFNKACADTLKGKSVKSAMEGVNENKLNEMDINDPVLMAVRARSTMIKKNKEEWKGFKKLSLDQYWKKLEYRSFIETQMKDAAKELEQLDSDMNADAGQKGKDWSDADANRYGGDLDKLQTKVEKLAKLKAKVNKSIMHYRTH